MIGPELDVRAEHPGHVAEPPRTAVRRRANELHDVESGEGRPQRSEDDRHDAEPLPTGPRPDQPEHDQRGAHGDRHERGRPVERAGALTWPLARDGAIAAERHVEAEDGQQRQEDLRAPERQGDGRHRDDRHRPEIDLAPEPMRAAALHGEHRQRRENEGDRAGRDVDPAQRRDQSFSRPFPGRTARPGARRRRRCAGAGDTAPSGPAPRDAPVWRSPCGARSHTRESSGPRRA